MSKYLFVLFFSLLLLACTTEQFPEPVSKKISDEILTINTLMYMKGVVEDDSLLTVISDELLDQLVQMKAFYEQKSVDFDLTSMEEFWQFINDKDGYFSFSGIKKWIASTGFLFEITGDEKYIAELEKIRYAPEYILDDGELDEIRSLLEPFIFTRNNDFFHINLFANATVSFEHSMFGKIEITQETDFPESGNVNLKFKAEDDRYMEIFIRIPEWAEGATVTMENVKYLAPPGGYSQIAKKWHDGDLVEINFPMENLPDYYRY